MLHDLQAEFAAAIFDPELPPPSDVIMSGRAPSERRFNVYRNNVIASLVDILEAYFPVVARLLGEDYFRATARSFVASHPPQSPILSRYGAHFPFFLTAFAPVQDLPYLPDVARLEWLRQRAYHAADAPVLTTDDLMNIPPEQVSSLQFTPHSALGLFTSAFPAVSIWRTNTHDDCVEPIDSARGGECALVVRPQFDVLVVPVPSAALAFGAALAGGEPLGPAASRVATDHPGFDLQSAIVALIVSGALGGYGMTSKIEEREECA